MESGPLGRRSLAWEVTHLVTSCIPTECQQLPMPHQAMPNNAIDSPVNISLSLILVLPLVVTFISWLYSTPKRRPSLPLPPGPKPLPLLGNLFDVPQEKPWITYMGWSRSYASDIIFITVFSQPTVVVSSADVAFELMEKRSKIYSDKPRVIMDELVGWDWNMGLMPYGQRWRNTRRCFHQHFNQGVVGKYNPIQIREVQAFLRRALALPGDVEVKSISQTIAAIIVGITYGIQIHDMSDDYIKIAHKSVEGLNLARRPGAFWVDYFPLLRHIPAWVPGASGKQLGRFYKPLVEEMKNRPFNTVKNDVLTNMANPSVAEKVIVALQRKNTSTEAYNMMEQVARDALGIAYAAAVDTQFSTLTSFILAMAVYPDVQRKAQQELDALLCFERLPDLSDRESLPYIQAVMLESLRWIPVLPLGVPHRVLVDDEYHGYRIPKGSIIVANAWAMLHDPGDYPNPDDFNPDRFLRNNVLDPDVRDPATIAFGFGRRICAGRHLAKDTLFLFMASVLCVFDIVPATDADGRPVQVKPGSTSGFLSYPDSLPCAFKPRSAAAERLVRNSQLL